MQLTQDADANSSAPDRFFSLTVRSNGSLTFNWDDRSGVNGHYNTVEATGVEAMRWTHVGMQKSPDTDTVRVYLNGDLKITETATYPISSIDVLIISRSGQPTFREFLVRANAPLPTIPYTPGVVSFAGSIGNPQKRWNSYML